MTKQEFYAAPCKEAGTYEGTGTADEWYVACGHNITPDMDETFARAAAGDVAAISEARQSVGLPVLV